MRSTMLRLIVQFFLVFQFTVVRSQTLGDLKNSLPDAGKIVNDKPVGKGWTNLLSNLDEWQTEKEYWTLSKGVLRAEGENEKLHHYAWTKKTYGDFELNVMIKMVGDEDANSGVCIRLHPVNHDDAPGYQIDMGKKYWGSLWEERRAGMVQKYPDSLAAKLVKDNDWNHYYIVAKGHQIQAWLNGVKTIDIIHETGFTDGAVGFQLCHQKKHTVVEVKTFFIRE